MKILLTNDDGYESVGLMLLCEKLASLGHDVYVVAPDGQRSAFSHSVNLHKELTIRKLDNYCGAKLAYISSGTPADCVKFATATFNDTQFDLVVSGPNNGENLGFAVLYSGTVAAAEEGVLCGIRSIALSRIGWYADGGSFSSAVEYICANLETLYDNCAPTTLLNVNVPDLPLSKIAGVKVCPLNASRIFFDRFENLGNDVWRISGERAPISSEEYDDIVLSDKGFITLTPISVLRTDTTMLERIKGLEK